jgi:hypothetical protein
MNLHDRLNLTGGVLVTALPCVVFVILQMRRGRYLDEIPLWRYRMALGGLVLGLLASLPVPLFYLVLELPQRMQGDWLLGIAVRSMLTAFYVGVVAVVLLAFAHGFVRWVGIAAMLVSVAFLYVTLAGLAV